MKVGAAFSEHIHTEKPSLNKKAYHVNQYALFRITLLPICIVLFALLLIGRLFFLQVLFGSYYRNLSDSNRIRTQIIHGPRGIIFDRNGKPLVYNVPGYREVINGKTNLLDQKQALAQIANGDKHLEIDNLRRYPLGDAASHVIGYIGQITGQDLRLPQFSTYASGDLIGKMGIEEEYESMLRGIDGKMLIEVDATGKAIRTLGQTDPTAGQNITLTIDSLLQQEVYGAMRDVTKGAAIVSMPNGEVLALVSKPSFDPNLFTMGRQYQPMENTTYHSVEQVLLDNESEPVLNRAISGVYAPGSTFKIVVAASGLETKTIDSNFTVEDNGILRVGDFSFANWYYTQYGRTEGAVDVVKALKRSNDIFFYKVGQMIGVDKLSAFAKKFGLGSRLGIQLPGEAKGLLPTQTWKETIIGDKWYLGDDYHYGIGQGYLLTTPLQVNAWTQAIANGGTLYQPSLLKYDNRKIIESNFLHADTTSLVREGMIEACSTGGVAWPLFNFSVINASLPIDGKNILEVKDASNSAIRQIVVACKTGTAQHGSDTTLPHAWITLFAPAYNPQIIVTILAEDSGEGSNVAGPIAKQILQDWFGRK